MKNLLSSWVRGLVQTKIGLQPKISKVTMPKANYEMDSVFANLNFFENIVEVVDSAFGSHKEAVKAFGEVNFHYVCNDIATYVFMNTLDTYSSAPREVYENEVYADRSLTVAFLPVLFENKNQFTDRKSHDLTWLVLLDIPGILYKDKSGRKKQYSFKTTGGHYAKVLSTIVSDISNDTLGSSTLFHEMQHAVIRQLRGHLDDVMYDVGANQREEIIVHYMTDLQMYIRATYDMFVGTKFTRDGDMNLTALEIPVIKYQAGTEDDRIVDSYSNSGEMSITKLGNGLANIRSCALIKKSKNQTVRDIIHKDFSILKLPTVIKGKHVDSMLSSLVNEFESHKSKSNRRK